MSNGDAGRGALPTREETIAWLVSNFESRLWRTANDDYQLRLLSRYEVEAVKHALTDPRPAQENKAEVGPTDPEALASTERDKSVPNTDRDAIAEECAALRRFYNAWKEIEGCGGRYTMDMAEADEALRALKEKP